MRGVVVVGERMNRAPWRPAIREHELSPRFLLKLGAFNLGSGRRVLAKSLGLRWDAAMNLLMPAWNGTEEWDHRRAQQVAGACRSYLEAEFTTIVLLGRRVTRAFGLEHLDFLQAEWPYAILPHPSGLNRWWNEEPKRLAAQRFAAQIVERSYRCSTIQTG